MNAKRKLIRRHRGIVSPLSATIKEVENELTEYDRLLLTEDDIISVAADVDADEQEIPLSAKINFHLAIQRGVVEESI